MGGGKPAFAIADGVCERSANVAEKLGFEKLFGDRTAVDCDEHFFSPSAVVVESAGDQFLAGSAFAGDEDGTVGVGNLLDEFKYLSQRLATADDAVEFMSRPQFVLKKSIFPSKAAVFNGLPDKASDDVEVFLLEGLLQVPEGSRLQGLDRAFGTAVTGDDDAREIGCGLGDLSYDLKPAHSGHLDVAEDQIKIRGIHDLEGLGSLTGQYHFVSGSHQDPFKGSSIQLLVVYDEDVGLTQNAVLRFAEGGAISVGETLERLKARR
jgi:hypothetical protein